MLLRRSGAASVSRAALSRGVALWTKEPNFSRRFRVVSSCMAIRK